MIPLGIPVELVDKAVAEIRVFLIEIEEEFFFFEFLFELVALFGDNGALPFEILDLEFEFVFFVLDFVEFGLHDFVGFADF